MVIHFTKTKLIARSVPVLKLPEKNVLFPLLKKSRVSAENTGIKVSAIQPSGPLFTAIVLPIL